MEKTSPTRNRMFSSWIALGSNLGDRRSALDSALGELQDSGQVRIEAVASYWETPPIGGPPGQGPFLNSAASLRTTLDAPDLHQLLRQTELRAGRKRIARWGERTLDLDLLLYEDMVRRTPELSIPHPRMNFRRFVLGPLQEIAPDLIEPTTGLTISRLVANLDQTPRRLGAFRGLEWTTDSQRRFLEANLADWSIDWDWAPDDLRPALVVRQERDDDDDHQGFLPIPALRIDPNDEGALGEILAACRSGDKIPGLIKRPTSFVIPLLIC